MHGRVAHDTPYIQKIDKLVTKEITIMGTKLKMVIDYIYIYIFVVVL